MELYLSLGANIGQREQTIQSALSLLSQQLGPMLRVSDYYYSEPWGFDSENAFCNCCACFDTELEPHEILRITQQVERELGRNHKSVQRIYHDRTIDIDIILYGSVELNTPELTIPHPLYREREFVMIPLREVLV